MPAQPQAQRLRPVRRCMPAMNSAARLDLVRSGTGLHGDCAAELRAPSYAPPQQGYAQPAQQSAAPAPAQTSYALPPPPPSNGGGFFAALFGHSWNQAAAISRRRRTIRRSRSKASQGRPGQGDMSTYPGRSEIRPPDRRLSRRREGRHYRHRYAEQISLSGRGRRQGAALRHRRRPSRLHLGRREDDLPPSANGRIGGRRRTCCSAGPICRVTCPAAWTIRSARARCISARRSTASTAPTSLGPSAPTCRRAASACAMRTSRISTVACKVGTKVVVI